MYTPEGYVGDPPDAKCPHCGQKGKSCSYVNSLSRAWQGVLVLKKIKNFLERDQDITYYDEFHYIYITLRELIEVIKTGNNNL